MPGPPAPHALLCPWAPGSPALGPGARIPSASEEQARSFQGPAPVSAREAAFLDPRANPAGPVLPEPFPAPVLSCALNRERICNLLVWLLLYLPTRIEGPGRYPCTLCLK